MEWKYDEEGNVVMGNTTAAVAAPPAAAAAAPAAAPVAAVSDDGLITGIRAQIEIQLEEFATMLRKIYKSGYDDVKRRDRERARKGATPHLAITALFRYALKSKGKENAKDRSWGFLAPEMQERPLPPEAQLKNKLVFILIDIPNPYNTKSPTGYRIYHKRVVPVIFIGKEGELCRVQIPEKNPGDSSYISFTVEKKTIQGFVQEYGGNVNQSDFLPYKHLLMSGVPDTPRLTRRSHYTQLGIIFDFDRYRQMVNGNGLPNKDVHRLELTVNTPRHTSYTMSKFVLNTLILCQKLIDEVIIAMGTRCGVEGFAAKYCFTGVEHTIYRKKFTASMREVESKSTTRAQPDALAGRAHVTNCGFVAAVLSSCFLFINSLKLAQLGNNKIRNWLVLCGALDEGFGVPTPPPVKQLLSVPENQFYFPSSLYLNWERLFIVSGNIFGTLLGYGHDDLHGVNVNFKNWFLPPGRLVQRQGWQVALFPGVNFVTIFSRHEAQMGTGSSYHHFFVFKFPGDQDNLCLVADAWAGGRAGGREGWVRCMRESELVWMLETLHTTKSIEQTNGLINTYFSVPYYRSLGATSLREALGGEFAFIGNIPISYLIKEFLGGRIGNQSSPWSRLAYQLIRDFFLPLQPNSSRSKGVTHGGSQKKNRKTHKNKRKTRKKKK